jgi:hypothetical protein
MNTGRFIAGGVALWLMGVTPEPAWATGPNIPLTVLPTLDTADGKPSPVEVKLLVDTVFDILVSAEIRRPDGSSVGANRYDGVSVFSSGIGVDESLGVAASAGDVIRFRSGLDEALGDGVYVDQVRFDVLSDDTEYPVTIVEYRYFKVDHGKVSALTSTEYTALTSPVVGNVRAAGPAVARQATGRAKPVPAVQVSSADTGVRGNDSERGER